MPGELSTWLAYVLVDDIAVSTQKAKSLGAKIIRDVIEVPRAGWLSITSDPTGAALGLWKPRSAEAAIIDRVGMPSEFSGDQTSPR